LYSKKYNMKKIGLLSLCFVYLLSNAQNIKLEKGKKITSKTVMSMDMDMGMGGQMKMVNNTTALIEVTGMDDKNYKATTTITKITSTSEMMGKETIYDSDKKEDRDSEAGKAFGKMLNKPTEVDVDKATGKAKEIPGAKVTAEDDEDASPFAGLMGGGDKPNEATTAAAFFLIPADKKTGDKWTENTEIQGLKAVKNYEIKSLENGIATLLVKTTGKGSVTKEAKGMQFELDMETTGENTMIVDTKTGLVKKNTGTVEVTGTMGVMGQTMPMTIKTSVSTEFE
jgi:hypothetical protein